MRWEAAKVFVVVDIQLIWLFILFRKIMVIILFKFSFYHLCFYRVQSPQIPFCWLACRLAVRQWVMNSGSASRLLPNQPLQSSSIHATTKPKDHRAEYSLQCTTCAVCSVQCAVQFEMCCVQSAVCSLKCAICSVLCAVCSLQFVVCSGMCSVQCAMCCVHITYYTVQGTQ